jgi:Spy/CpxP family protein refolding chaperone
MKKLLAIALSFSLFALTANAQISRNSNEQNKVQRDSLHKRNGSMMKDLNLSNAQKAQLKESRESAKQQMEAIKNDASLTQDQKKEKMQELRKSQQEKMSSILTPDQKAKIHAERKDWKDKNMGQKGQHKMTSDLNLTDVQKAQMKANHEAIQQQREAIKNDATLTDIQKKEKMQELHKAQKEKMSSILTADQKAKMKAERKEWKDKNKDQKTHPKKNTQIDTKKNVM